MVGDSEMEKHCVGSQGQWIVVLKKINKKEMHNYITLSLLKSEWEWMSSAVYLENVSENYGVGILCNLNSVRNVFKGLT
jgi:hypothetical protein